MEAATLNAMTQYFNFCATLAHLSSMNLAGNNSPTNPYASMVNLDLLRRHQSILQESQHSDRIHSTSSIDSNGKQQLTSPNSLSDTMSSFCLVMSKIYLLVDSSFLLNAIQSIYLKIFSLILILN